MRSILRAVELTLLASLLCLLVVKMAEAQGVQKADASAAKSPQVNNSRKTVVEVNGRTLSGPLSLPEQHGANLFVPVAAISNALGDSILINARSGGVELRRQTGELVEIDFRLKQIRENGTPVLSFSEEYALELPLRVEELMLPVELASALFGASIHLDESAGIVRVTRGNQGGALSKASSRRGSFEIFNLDYEYALNSYGAYRSYGLTMRSTGRIGDGRYNLIMNSGSGGGNRLFGPLRGGTFTFESAGGRRLVIGDFGTGTELEFLPTNLRGGQAQATFGSVRVTAFGGRSVSGLLPSNSYPALYTLMEQQQTEQTKGLGYDTTIFGAYASFGTTGRPLTSGGNWLFSAGAMHFGGKRTGNLISASSSYTSRRRRLQGDFAFGSFKGLDQSGQSVEGMALAADLSGSYDISNSLSVQGRYTYIGKNFLAPQSGLFQPVKQWSAGMSWRPTGWLSANLSGGITERLEAPGGKERNFATSLSLNPGGAMPSLFISHTRFSSAQMHNSSYTLLSVSKDFSGIRAFVNTTRVQTLGEAVTNFQGGADMRLGDGRLLVTQAVGSRGSMNGTAEWTSSKLFRSRVIFGGGLGYSRGGNSPLMLTQKASATVQLPHQNTLQFTYTHNQGGSQFHISLRGSLLRRPETALLASVPVAEMRRFGTVYGRVYQDNNQNGKYDPTVDRPQANVRVRIDGNLYAVSDASGLFRIDNVEAGEHQTYIDLLTVRADLTLLDEARREVILEAGHDAVMDFRLARTGRVSGSVWLDENGNGLMDGNEQPLANIRIVCGNARDTLTDENGVFTLGDIAPGQYVLLIDEKTLPEGTKSKVTSTTINVIAGQEKGGAKLPVITIQPEVKMF